ncbi:hypothetical protein HN51_070269 [Arachis hypogaea]
MASAGQAAAVAVDACKEDRESEGDRAEEKQRVRRRKEEEPSRTATASPALSCDGGGSRRRDVVACCCQDGENPAEEAKESNHGRLLACIASRPDQCGRDDGYILEGELEFYMKKIQKGKGAVFILILVYWMGWNRSYNDFSYLHVIF